MFSRHEWAVELDAVGKSYPAGWTGARRWVLHDLSLRVRPGQVLGLFGPNGCGKSTTLKVLAGLVAPSRGVCRVHGHVAGGDAARALVGYLPDDLRCPARLTGREWLGFVAALAGAGPEQVAGSLADVGLAAMADRRIGDYSQGLRQRLGLAQATLPARAVLLLDEPVNGLDLEGRRMFSRLIRAVAAAGRTVVFSSHLLSHAEHVCDRIALLGPGRLLREGTPADLLGAGWQGAETGSPLERVYSETLAAS